MTGRNSGATSTAPFSRQSLLADGFEGFVTFEALGSRAIDDVPQSAGIYTVLRIAETPPTFLERSSGGRFKGREPAVPIAQLTSNWVDGSVVTYIGKAENLCRRVRQYRDFGSGRPVGHWGGRYVWQLADSSDLLVAWRRCRKGETSRGLEAGLLAEFHTEHGRLPFANLRR